MKAIKMSDEYYDKVKALSDSSGESIREANDKVVAAGLGELKQLGNELKGALSNEAIGVSKKPGDAKKVEGKTLTKADVTEAVVEEEGSNEWIWVVGALLAVLALKQRVARNSLPRIV